MKKMHLTVTVIVVLLSLAIGPVAFAAKTKLNFAYWGGIGHQEIFKPLFEQFEAENPDIELDIMNISNFTDYTQRLLAMIAGGVAPDVMMIGGEWFPSYIVGGALMPLESLIEQDPTFDLDDYFESVLSYHYWDDKLYGLPKDYNVTVLYYNRNLFDQAGLTYPNEDWTWDDLLHSAEKLTVRSGRRTTQWGYSPQSHNMAADLYFTFQNDGQMFDDYLHPTRCTMTDPAVVEAITFLHDLINKYEVAPSTTVFATQNARDMFTAGRLAMLTDHRGPVPTFRNITDFEWDTAVLPSKVTKGSIINTAGFAISNQTKHPDAAWRLLKFMAGPVAQTAYIAGGNALPPRKSVAESGAFFSELPPDNDMAYIEMTEYAHPLPLTPLWGELNTAYKMTMEKVWIGEMTPAAAAREVEEKLNALLQN